MTTLAVVCQIIIALGIINVWILRRDRPTPYRPDGAASIQEEFDRYGLPDWAWRVVGTAKLTLAGLLLVGIFVPAVASFAAAGMALLMLGAVSAHVRVSDPAIKSMPAFLMMLLSTVVVVAYTI